MRCGNEGVVSVCWSDRAAVASVQQDRNIQKETQTVIYMGVVVFGALKKEECRDGCEIEAEDDRNASEKDLDVTKTSIYMPKIEREKIAVFDRCC